MNVKFNDLEFKDVVNLISGFTVKDQEALKFNFVASPNLTFNDAMQLIQSMTYQLLYAFITQKPEAKEDVYDAYNFMASTILQNLIPDKELRADITEEAILELETKKIEEQYKALTPEQKAEALKNIDKLKEHLKNGD